LLLLFTSSRPRARVTNSGLSIAQGRCWEDLHRLIVGHRLTGQIVTLQAVGLVTFLAQAVNQLPLPQNLGIRRASARAPANADAFPSRDLVRGSGEDVDHRRARLRGSTLSCCQSSPSQWRQTLLTVSVFHVEGPHSPAVVWLRSTVNTTPASGVDVGRGVTVAGVGTFTLTGRRSPKAWPWPFSNCQKA
jgi:hypothetical protein